MLNYWALNWFFSGNFWWIKRMMAPSSLGCRSPRLTTGMESPSSQWSSSLKKNCKLILEMSFSKLLTVNLARLCTFRDLLFLKWLTGIRLYVTGMQLPSTILCLSAFTTIRLMPWLFWKRGSMFFLVSKKHERFHLFHPVLSAVPTGSGKTLPQLATILSMDG